MSAHQSPVHAYGSPVPTGGGMRGRPATPLWARFLSLALQLVLSLGLFAWLAGYSSQMALQIQLLRPTELLPMLLCVLGVAVTALLMGLANRLSSLGAVAGGLVWMVVGVLSSFSLDVQDVIISSTGALPRPLQQGALLLFGYGGVLLIGSLLVAGGLGAAWARRSRR